MVKSFQATSKMVFKMPLPILTQTPSAVGTKLFRERSPRLNLIFLHAMQQLQGHFPATPFTIHRCHRGDIAHKIRLQVPRFGHLKQPHNPLPLPSTCTEDSIKNHQVRPKFLENSRELQQLHGLLPLGHSLKCTNHRTAGEFIGCHPASLHRLQYLHSSLPSHAARASAHCGSVDHRVSAAVPGQELQRQLPLTAAAAGGHQGTAHIEGGRGTRQVQGQLPLHLAPQLGDLLETFQPMHGFSL